MGKTPASVGGAAPGAGSNARSSSGSLPRPRASCGSPARLTATFAHPSTTWRLVTISPLRSAAAAAAPPVPLLVGQSGSFSRASATPMSKVRSSSEIRPAGSRAKSRWNLRTASVVRRPGSPSGGPGA